MRLIKKIMFLFVIVSVMSGCDFKTNGNNQESKNINDLSFSAIIYNYSPQKYKKIINN